MVEFPASHVYHLVIEHSHGKKNHKWRFLAGKIIYFYGPFSMAMLVITKGYKKSPSGQPFIDFSTASDVIDGALRMQSPGRPNFVDHKRTTDVAM